MNASNSSINASSERGRTASSGRGRTIVVGLDGASFTLLEPWIEAGELPTIERIVGEGVSGELESVLPPITSPNWKAYATGKNPGKLGIFWWRNVDVENGRTYVPSDRYHANTEYWEIISENEPVGVIGVPMTNPPKALDAFVVPAGVGEQPSEVTTHPQSLRRVLEDRFDYRFQLEYSLREGTREAYEGVHEYIDTKFTAAKYLLDRYDVSFLQLTTFQINQLHHHIWDHEATLAGWKIIDGHLESFLEDGNNVVLMSDHGMARIESIFRINHWLKEEGYLAYDTGTSETLYDLGINTGRLKQLLKRADRHVPAADLMGTADRVVPQWLLNYLPNDRGSLGVSKFSQVDWENSRAIASAQGPVYLTLDRDEPGYDRLREELVEKLSELTDPSGRPIADAVHRSEDIYTGPYVEEAPDIVIEQAEGMYIVEGIGQRDVFGEVDETWQAVNAPTGFFAATGPAFASGSIEDLSILDLAPTLLHLHDCEIPTDMDGTVRTDVFERGTAAADREPTYGPPRHGQVTGGVEGAATDAESDDMRQRLKDLGYI